MFCSDLMSGSHFIAQTSKFLLIDVTAVTLGQGHGKVIQYISPDPYIICAKYQKFSSNGFEVRGKSFYGRGCGWRGRGGRGRGGNVQGFPPCLPCIKSHGLLCVGFPVMPYTPYIPWLTMCTVSRNACHSLYPMAYRVQGFPACLPPIISHGLPCAGFPIMPSTYCIPWLTVCRVSRHAFHPLYPMAYRVQGFPSCLHLIVSHG